MRIVVCAKEVLDPDAVNAYAVAGRLSIGEDGKTISQSSIPRLMNGYDQQAIEAALRLRDAGVDCTITVVSVALETSQHLRRAAALGVDELALITEDPDTLDNLAVGTLLAAYIRHQGGADLVLCGRQASDDDQGVVPAVVAEQLGTPLVTMARDVRLVDGVVRVVRVTPDGDETVECALPAVVTVSNELGVPRFPKAAGMMAARRMKPVTLSAGDLGLGAAALAPRMSLVRMYVPTVQGDCTFITGETPRDAAEQLLRRLRDDGVLR